MEKNLNLDDWATLTQFFPEGWEEKAKELDALKRKRKFKSAQDLLRTLLIHLSDDSSLVETAARAKLYDIASVSDVALLKRLKASAEWLRWLAKESLNQMHPNLLPPEEFSKYYIRTIDASMVSEPGSTGTDWRLHYSMELFNLQCDEFNITPPSTGESFLNFNVSPRDLLIGDRAYGRYNSMRYVLGNNGDFIVRFTSKAFTIYNLENEKIDLLKILNKLDLGKTLNLKCLIGVKGKEKLPVRICAVKKNDMTAMKSIKKARNKRKRERQVSLCEETLEFHRYIIIITSLPETISAERILELYRLRWQIELAFKRLKSLFGFGHLPKKDKDAGKAWLHGKLFVALLSQRIIDECQFFSPWGYPLKASA